MPQIWLKRRLYDGLTKREINVEAKVDELVEDFLTFLKKKESWRSFAERVEEFPESLILEKDEKEEDASDKNVER